MNSYRCKIILDAEEHRGDGDSGGNWTARPRYSVTKHVDLPFRPRKGIRLSNLLPNDPELALALTDDMNDDNDFLGLPIQHVTFCMAENLFCVSMFVTILLPWETTPETIKARYPGWDFTFSEDHSAGFDPKFTQSSGG